MRSFLKIFVTFVVLAGGFAAYVLLQPASTFRTESNVRPAAQTLVRGEGGIIGSGENAWVRQFDDEGRLASRFRAARWEPQKSGLVRVIRPEAELFLKGGKDKEGNDKPRPRVVISGDDGEVVVQSLPDAAAADKPLQSSQGTPLSGGGNESMGPAQPPSSGRLNGVVIQVFESEDGTDPVVTLKTNNIVFDNDTFRISTESYIGPDGVTVPPQEVPVSVEGPHFDFYGRGLTVRWNDLEERLDLLRIARGDRLVIRNMDALSAPGRASPLSVPATKPSEPSNATAARDAAPLWAMLASADPGAAVALAAADGAARAATAPASKPARRRNKDGDKQGEKDKKDEDEPTYRAAFHDGVRVVQGEQQLAVASLMNVDFLLGQREKPEGPATRPAATQSTTAPASTQTVAATQSEASTQSTTGAATQPAATQPGASTKPAKVAATQPVPAPVTVYWTGELNVTPLPAPAPGAAPSTAARAEAPLPPGEARVELIGAPVVLTRDLLDVRTARFVYRTDGRVALDSSPELPRVLLTQRSAEEGAPDTTVSTEGLVYSLNEKLAILRGQSRVLAPIDAGGLGADGATTQPVTQPATQPATRPAPEMLDASWSELATFRLQGESEADLWVEQAEFTGNVDIKAPQGAVRSHHLELAFDAPLPPKDDLKEVPRAAPQSATQPADDASKPKANPQPNLRRIVATENVYCELIDAVEGRRVLQAQRLALDTARSDTGDLYPRVVDAAGEVRASTDEQELSAGHVVLHLRPATKRTEPEATQPQEEQPHEEQPHQEQPAAPRTPRAIVADAAGAGLPAAVRRAKDDRPPVELESMTATDAVRVASKDGAVATGRRLHVAVDADGQPHVELSGDPARVEDAANGSLTGPRILLDPKAGLAHVPGPGTLRAIQRDDDPTTRPATADAGAAPGAPATRPAGRPIEVTWADGADVRAADNRIDIKGMVSLWITDTDGSVRTANAGRVTVELARKSPEKAKEKKVNPEAPARDGPAREADAVAEATAEPAPADEPKKSAKADELAGSLKMDLFKDKEVAKVNLYDDAVINSKLAAADGTLLRQFHLKARHITYDVRARHLTVPGPGQMLVESHDPAADEEPKQANAGADGKREGEGKPGGDAAAFTGGNGISAFQWAESLTYEESAGRATMGGSVVVSHQADGKNQPVVRLDADTLTAEFDVKQDEPKETASAEKAPTDEADEPRLQLRSISAAGNILIARDGAELSAHRIDFDPGTSWVIARGTPRGPATFSDPSGAGTMRADELWLNTKTWAVKVKNVNTRVGGLSR